MSFDYPHYADQLTEWADDAAESAPQFAEDCRVMATELKRISEAEPFGYFRAEPFGWTDCDATDEGATPLLDLSTSFGCGKIEALGGEK